MELIFWGLAWPSTRLAFSSPPSAWCVTMREGGRRKLAMELRWRGRVLVGSMPSHSAGALAYHHAIAGRASTARAQASIHGTGAGSHPLSGCSSALGPLRSSAAPAGDPSNGAPASFPSSSTARQQLRFGSRHAHYCCRHCCSWRCLRVPISSSWRRHLALGYGRRHPCLGGVRACRSGVRRNV